jgi:galactofuranosylgalactofuranosylrhamnosyl-N-acetylglucosaminyl-diphospho-decaprenol beta-1,5/1,6-galactofuranosyltransferase
VTKSSTAELRELPAAEGYRIVQRLSLRGDLDHDIRPLYVSEFENVASDSGTDDVVSPVVTTTTSRLSKFGRIDESGNAIVEAGQRLNLCAYFNAFPASYWRRWTSFDNVRLTVRASGDGNINVFRSTAKGHMLRVDSAQVKAEEPTELTFDLPLKPFIDGGWYWFEVEAGDADTTLEQAHWSVETDRQQYGRLSIAITTFNRPDFCVDQLLNLASTPAVREVIDRIIVVDQGNQQVRDEPRFEQAAAELGDQLKLIEQPNLGGSGGFSRGMNEAAYHESSDYVLLLDDDVVCEMDGVLRALTFADLAKTPVIVGGHMLSLYDRTVLHAYGEALNPYTWFWGPAPSTKHGHNFANQALQSTQWLHRRVDVDYNGWWMCMIPTDVVRKVGLSLPMFIKWDDAEFGIRARSQGFPTVSLPGSAVWHVPWTEKDDTLDWQAYFHQRNRLISALMHSPYERGGRLVLESYQNHVKRLVAMQYSTGKAILWALEDVLAGPENMHRDMVTRLPQIRAMRAEYSDGQFSQSLDEFPAARRAKPPKRGGPAAPKSTLGRLKLAAKGVVKQAIPPRSLAETHPEALVPHVDLSWWRVAQFDSAIVSSADGLTASWYKRNQPEFKEQMRQGSKLHARLYRDWDKLAEQYRAALPQLASPEAWSETFEGLHE